MADPVIIDDDGSGPTLPPAELSSPDVSVVPPCLFLYGDGGLKFVDLLNANKQDKVSGIVKSWVVFKSDGTEAGGDTNLEGFVITTVSGRILIGDYRATTGIAKLKISCPQKKLEDSGKFTDGTSGAIVSISVNGQPLPGGRRLRIEFTSPVTHG